ncbi:MAG: HAD family hydrolase [Nonomuraea sp.]|nr:HAD family hydrolase [Nonomuraea sp.]NUP66780.1 HAD family hydrolase [Nonomuraea sp.]NUP80293.1 HAD family hydrolase [Nonomuraea sp.]
MVWRVIRAVVIDVDDTLCLTEAACFELENDVLARLGLPPMAREAHLATWGQPLHEAMPRRSPGLDLDAYLAVHPVVLREYVAAGRMDIVTEDNLAALGELAAAGREVMVLTSRTEAEVEHLLAPGHALAGRLAAVYHAGNVRFCKPDPRAFDELLAATGLDPRQCLYVGDSPTDAQAANGAGLRFVACMQSGIRRPADFGAYRVDAFIDTFPELVGAVARLEGAARVS